MLLAFAGCHSDESLSTNDFLVYPNPVQSLMNVRVNNQSNADYLFEVFSANGDLLKRENIGAGVRVYNVDVSKSPGGVLNAVLTTEKGVSIIKVYKK